MNTEQENDLESRLILLEFLMARLWATQLNAAGADDSTMAAQGRDLLGELRLLHVTKDAGRSADEGGLVMKALLAHATRFWNQVGAIRHYLR